MEIEKKNSIKISGEYDIISCRKKVRDITIKLGFDISDQTRVVTTASELARNIFNYAQKGTMTMSVISGNMRKGIKLVFEDNGPGLDPDDALTPGFSTSKGLGMGLPGSKKLMDEFELHSERGKGTTVTVVKWMRE